MYHSREAKRRQRGNHSFPHPTPNLLLRWRIYCSYQRSKLHNRSARPEYHLSLILQSSNNETEAAPLMSKQLLPLPNNTSANIPPTLPRKVSQIQLSSSTCPKMSTGEAVHSRRPTILRFYKRQRSVVSRLRAKWRLLVLTRDRRLSPPRLRC